MTDRELMQQALDALESVFEGDDKGAEYWTVTGGTYEAVECMNAMRALRARLGQPEPEPVGWFMEGTFEDGTPSFTQVCESDPEFYVPLYTTPPQREWQGLTDDEILEEYRQAYGDDRDLTDVYFARAIEAKLKEKNYD